MNRRAVASLDSPWVLEDTSSYHARALERRDGTEAPAIAVRLHRVRDGRPELVEELSYVPHAERRGRGFKGALGADLLRRARVCDGVVAAGARFAQGTAFFDALAALGLDYVVAVPPGSAGDRGLWSAGTAEALETAAWRESTVTAPHSTARYAVADLGCVMWGGRSLRQLALSTGGIANFRRGLVVGVTSLGLDVEVERIADVLGWSRWIRHVDRRAVRTARADRQPTVTPAAPLPAVGAGRALEAAPAVPGGPAGPARATVSAAQRVQALASRVNRKLAHRQDEAAGQGDQTLFDGAALRGRLATGRDRLNVVELFAGAGGMGLGLLTARAADPAVQTRFRVLFSGEIDPVAANTLRVNHDFLRGRKAVGADDVPHETAAADLRAPSSMDRVQAVARAAGGVDVVIGGPPCQGFSAANRNSGASDNPNNRLVDTYLDYVVRLRPRVFLMENVQGILWTSRHDAAGPSVAEHIAARLAAAGYHIFPKLLDAAWYGVPQHRNRFFLLGLHRDLGYAQDDFGPWGPFPRPSHGPAAQRPYVTVREAIGDLPAVENAAEAEAVSYGAPPAPAGSFLEAMRAWAPEAEVWDHVTSRHADYVLERYRQIPPGGNWSDIAGLMTNYAAVERTHSNIYRRLSWDEPSVTIGHYRKSMLVHPDQHRGLSVREASRLQSFPDWFRFAGGAHQVGGGLTYKQQQLGNAVCPLVTRAIAEHLLRL